MRVTRHGNIREQQLQRDCITGGFVLINGGRWIMENIIILFLLYKKFN